MSAAWSVEVINTGTELLFGSVVNTHLAYLGQQLFSLGLRVDRQTTVPDGLGDCRCHSGGDIAFPTGDYYRRTRSDFR